MGWGWDCYTGVRKSGAKNGAKTRLYDWIIMDNTGLNPNIINGSRHSETVKFSFVMSRSVRQDQLVKINEFS
jgi:hypothetical protein